MNARRVELTVPVDVNAPAAVLWRAVTDWEGQGDWMLGTRVEVTSPGDGRGLGATLRAVTGVGWIGFTDTMEIVEWAVPDGDGPDGDGPDGDGPDGDGPEEDGPWPRRCVVRHTGRVVRGDGVFEVVELGPERARFRWTELLDLPLGAVGHAGWRLVRPAFRAGVEHSLRRMARLCEAGYRAGA